MEDHARAEDQEHVLELRAEREDHGRGGVHEVPGARPRELSAVASATFLPFCGLVVPSSKQLKLLQYTFRTSYAD